MSHAIELYEDAADEWRWRLRHQNGNILADSGEGYSSKSEAQNAIARVREHGREAEALEITSAIFEVYEDAGEEWRWRLRHRNSEILADSGEGYASRSAAVKAVSSVKRNGVAAEVRET